MIRSELVVSSGNIFLISDLTGDISHLDYQGLFSADVRHLSKLELLINNNPLEILTSQVTDFHSATIILSNGPSSDLSRADLTIIRRRSVTKVFHEDIELINNTQKQLDFTLNLAFDVDFSDIFEIRAITHEAEGQHSNKRAISKTFRKKEKQLIFSYAREAFRRTTVIHFSDNVKLQGNMANLTISLKPKQRFTFSFSIAFLAGRKTITLKRLEKIQRKSEVLKEWRWSKIKIKTDWDDLYRTVKKSINDLAALRIYEEEAGGKITSLPAAGIPWFVAIFGRDSLITAYQTLIFGLELATSTLKFLAKYQGKEINPLKDEQPGKILHEIRFGEVAFFRDWVQFPYYGTVDATPLFLILLSETYRFGASNRFIEQMREPALKALEWIDTYGDIDKDGFVEYQRGSEKGLENQNWRDSWDSMVFGDGSLAKTPIASSDVQGYVYDAKMRMSEIARKVWKDPELATKLEQEAKALKERFNQAFWVKDKGYFALGLDKNKKQIDSLSSSIGHLIWSGIINDDKIQKTVDSLFSDELYSGWGVRTISKNAQGYNPVIYHRGTVWPHDNSLIAAGLAKIGQREKALRIIYDTISASSYFGYRLPEVFAGFGSDEIAFPVQYPTSASPQAWSAATPILFMRLLLGIEPDTKHKTLKIDPFLPNEISYINIDGISAFGKQFSVEATKESSKITKKEG